MLRNLQGALNAARTACKDVKINTICEVNDGFWPWVQPISITQSKTGITSTPVQFAHVRC